MLNALYKLPRFLLVCLLVGGGIAFVILNDPPHKFCDTQIEHWTSSQKGILYDDPKDFKVQKSALKREQSLCRKEGSPGACYGYFSRLRQLLRSFRILSPECAEQVYAKPETQRALGGALTLMTALAYREEVLTGRAGKFNWLLRADMILFCDIKNKYIAQYGSRKAQALENQIVSLLPQGDKKISAEALKKKTILSENCASYK